VQKIEVVLGSDCVQSVSDALRRAKIAALQTSPVVLLDLRRGPDATYRGVSYTAGREKAKLELVLPDHEVQFAIEAICEGIEPFGEKDAELVVLEIQDVVCLRSVRRERKTRSMR